MARSPDRGEGVAEVAPRVITDALGGRPPSPPPRASRWFALDPGVHRVRSPRPDHDRHSRHTRLRHAHRRRSPSSSSSSSYSSSSSSSSSSSPSSSSPRHSHSSSSSSSSSSSRHSRRRSRSFSTTRPGQDDSKGHIMTAPGRQIGSKYVVDRVAGIGTFGKVFLCHNRESPDRIVALKVIRSIQKYVESAEVEAEVLRRIHKLDIRNESNIVHLYETFYSGEHYCMAFEALGLSIYDVLKQNDHQPFPMNLLRSLFFMHTNQLVHTDLKLENILFVDHDTERRTYRIRGKDRSLTLPKTHGVKIIDFGGATFSDQTKSHLINTRQYRAPEVILELGWSYPSDIWGAACILFELYSGSLLFATHDSAQHLSLMEKTVGRFPDNLWKRTHTKFFDVDGDLKFNSHGRSSLLKAVKEQQVLEDVIDGDDYEFLDLLSKMLVLDPSLRLPAADAVNHSFFLGID